jgi:oxepin-CoA hydrolase/3-oxo-5,6-dehydrosuberyl-CoA semialdehyde dehydrogenase
LRPDGARPLVDAVTGEVFAQAGNDALDMAAMRDHARATGGPALRAVGFHDRARMLKALATYLNDHKEALYRLSYRTGATLADSMIDIDGGIGTLFVYASKGRREMPDGHVYLDGAVEQLSRSGAFLGQHVCTPLHGVAVHINAFNFPVWGMLEKLAPTLLAGMPAIVKPATATCYLTEYCVRMIIDSGHPARRRGATGHRRVGDLLDRLDCQDVVGFTGSADTALKLRSAPHLIRQRGALRGRTGQPERLDPWPRCRAGHAGVRPVRGRGAPRDDREGGAEMHRDPPHHRAGRMSTR